MKMHFLSIFIKGSFCYTGKSPAQETDEAKTKFAIHCPFSGLKPPLSKRSRMFESHAEHA